LTKFNSIDKVGRFIQVDVDKLNMPIVFSPYERVPIIADKSQWTFKRKFLYAFDSLKNIPFALFLFSAVGSAFCFCGFLLFIEKREFLIVILLLLLLGIILSAYALIGMFYRTLNNNLKPDQFYSIASKSIP
jgi:hypothetical protein